MRVFDEDRTEARAMALAERAWPRIDQTRTAFDHVAADYDRSNAENPILCHMRRRTMSVVLAHAPAGARVLDLGCGPGADVELLARAGRSVTAIDWSPAMTDETRRRLRVSGIGYQADVHTLGIHELPSLPPQTFDVAYSNLGPLNCVPSLTDAARFIADRLPSGGTLIASVIGRICPWEIALYLSRGDWNRMRVRFARNFVAVPLSQRTVWTRYYTPGEFEGAFSAAGFVRVSLRALGLFAPPPYMQGLAERRPGFVARLQDLDEHLGAWPGLRSAGDHFLIVMRKQ
jgi:SAM-dependent methyltransferase